MKKITSFIGVLLCMIALWANQAQAQFSVSPHCTLKKDTIRLDIGQSDSVKVDVAPKSDTVAWKSKNPLIATVKYAATDSTLGKITALHAGETEIVVTSKSGKKDSCVVIVYKPVESVELLNIKGMPVETLKISISDTEKHTLYAKVNPKGANKKVNFFSLSEIATVSTVDTVGIIKAEKVGQGKIVVSAGMGEHFRTDTCLLIVNNPVTEVAFIYKDTVFMKINSQVKISAVVKPQDADDKKLNWSVEGTLVKAIPDPKDPLSAIVTSGVVPGNVKITALSSNGKRATCVVKVLPPPSVSGVSLNKDTLNMLIGTRDTVMAKIKPSDALNKRIIWESSNAAFASVSSFNDTTGVILANKLGSAFVVGRSEDGGFKDTCYVNVLAFIPVSGIDLDSTSIKLQINKKDTLHATIKPSDATNKRVVWVSANPAVVTVDSCVVKGVSLGKAWVYVKTIDGGYKDSCMVTVYDPTNIVPVENNSIWAFENGVRVKSEKPSSLYIYTVSGMLYRKEEGVSGERVIALPRGIYIVVMGDMRKKVLVQ